jgi:hypothetical protein
MIGIVREVAAPMTPALRYPRCVVEEEERVENS